MKASLTIATNEWFHLAITHSGTEVSIYSNNNHVYSAQISSELVSTNKERIKMGYRLAEDGTPIASADMAIACVGLFSEALNTSQIDDLMQRCDYSKCQCTSLCFFIEIKCVSSGSKICFKILFKY